MANGTAYEGDWVDGKFSKGECRYPDGKVYNGSWKDGKPYGHGIKSWPDGRKYEGEWKYGKPFGIGRKVYPNGDSKKGYWDKGKFAEGGKFFIHICRASCWLARIIRKTRRGRRFRR